MHFQRLYEWFEAVARRSSCALYILNSLRNCGDNVMTILLTWSKLTWILIPSQGTNTKRAWGCLFRGLLFWKVEASEISEQVAHLEPVINRKAWSGVILNTVDYVDKKKMLHENFAENKIAGKLLIIKNCQIPSMNDVLVALVSTKQQLWWQNMLGKGNDCRRLSNFISADFETASLIASQIQQLCHKSSWNHFLAHRQFVLLTIFFRFK